MHPTPQRHDMRRCVHACLITLLIWTLVFPPAIFVPRTARAAFVEAPGVQLPPVADASSQLAVGDLDGDAAPDVVVANHGQSRLWRNDGNGNFVDESATRLPLLDTVTTAVAVGDVDDDGAPDLVLADARGANRLLRNDGRGTFVDATAGRLPDQSRMSLDVALGDVDGNGTLDLVVANWNRPNQLFLNSGTGVFTSAIAGQLPADSDPSYAVALADVDGNGTLDLLIANHGAPSRLYLNNGLGVFTDVSATHLPATAGGSLDVTFADVDGDGDPDALIAAAADGLWLWLNAGNGIFTDVSATHLPALDAFGTAVAVGDVDEDGVPDVVLAAAGQDRILQNDGSGRFRDLTLSLLPVDTRRSVAVALVDVDGDLDQDLLLATPGDANRLLLNVLRFPRLRLEAAPPVVDLGNAVTLSVDAFDEDGLTAVSLTLNDPAGSTTVVDLTHDLVGGKASYLTTPDLTGEYTAAVTAEDTQGTIHSRHAAYTVLPPDINAPQVTVTVDTPAPILVGQPVALRVTATDDRHGVETTLTVNDTAVPLASDGTAIYVPTAAASHLVVARAADAAGNTATASTRFEVLADLQAPSLQVEVSSTRVALANPVTITVTATDNVTVTTQTLRVTGPSIPDGLDLSLDPAGQAVYTPFQPGTYTLEAAALDPSGNTGVGTATFDAEGVPDTNAPVVTLTVTPPAVAVGTAVTLTVTASDDVGVTATSLEINDTPVPLDATGTATYTPPVLGDYTAVAVARDAVGNTGSASAPFRAVDPASDTTPPLVRITTPADDSTLTAPTAIIGTVQDATLVRYTLEVSAHGDNQFTPFAIGTTEVFDGVLGTFDPSLLQNDLYDIRLTAEDINGHTASALVVYQVTGDLKVGHFTMVLEDLTIPVVGMPIAIRRVYDSRDKSVGDFGVGWRLDMQTIKVRENRVLGTAWSQGRINTFTYCLQPEGQHYVAITLPDGDTQTFDMTLTPACQALYPVQETTASFTARPGTFSSLEALTDNVLLVVGSAGSSVGSADPVELLHFDDTGDLAHYDPTRYRLTTKEGVEFTLDQNFGVRTVTDPEGNTLTFTDNGILHSAGKSVTFARDAQGRITTITDAAGNTIRYAYDAAGDLVSVTDREGYETTYSYNTRHGLLLGQHAGTPLLLNTYDAAGRLLSTTNAAGRTIGFGHDLDTRQEVITDTDGSITVVEYDAQGRIVRSTDPLGGVTTHTYDADGNQISSTNALGHTTTRTFDARGNTLTEADPLGHTSRFTYDDAGQLLTRTDANGHTTTFTYDAAGNLLTRVNALGVTEVTYTYDAQGNRQTVTDAIGRTITYTDDPSGQPTAVVDASGNVHTLAYDANGDLIADTDPDGRTITTTNDRRGLFVEKLDALGNITRFGYDAFGQLTSVTDAAGHTTSRVVDDRGNELQLTDPLGHTTTRVFDARDRLVSETDALGRTTTYQYDALERLIQTIYPDGSFTEVAYDLLGRAIEKTDANGNVWQFEYDAAGRNTRIVDPLGHSTTLAYDAVGNLIQQTDALGHTTIFDYDAVDRLSRITYADGSTEAFTYDAVGRVSSRTDAMGRVTQFGYDANDKITTVSDAAGHATGATYDARGRQLTQTDANGNTTRFTYDGDGHLIRTTFPDGSGTTGTYDSSGQLVAVTDANGSTVQFEYDALGRVTAKVYADGSRVAFTYTPTGQIRTITDGRGVTAYTYDARDRLARLTYADGSWLSYTYDAAGNRTSVTTQTSATAPLQTTTYTYDPLNRLQTVTDPAGNVSRYTYDAVGNRASLTYANGTVTTYGYDALHRLTWLEHRQGDTVLARYQYTLNAVGDRTRVEHLDGSSVEYAYDALRRLVRETHREAQGTVVYDWTYTYDAVGNRLSRTDVVTGVTTHYTYDVNDRLLAAGSVTYTYDANGNTRSRTDAAGTTVYSYDVDNRLVQLDTPDGSRTTYYYDSGGMRVQKHDATGLTAYLLDPRSPTGVAQVLVEYDTLSGNPQVSYVYGDDLISQARAGVSSFYHYDGTHHTRLLTDSQGVVTDTYTFDAFGLLLATSGTTPNLYLYSGEQYDPNSGFYYLRARYYAPDPGRFLTPDPRRGRLADPPSLHKYLYARSNPVTYTDPSGLVSVGETAVVSGIVNALVTSITAGLRTGSFTQAIFEGAVSGAFGLVSGYAGGKVATYLTSRFASEIVRNPILRNLFIPMLKAGLGTAGFYTQALVQKARGVKGAKLPSFGELIVVFAANVAYEGSLYLGVFYRVTEAAHAGLPSRIILMLNADKADNIFDYVRTNGIGSIDKGVFDAAMKRGADVLIKTFAGTAPSETSKLLLHGIEILGDIVAIISVREATN